MAFAASGQTENTYIVIFEAKGPNSVCKQMIIKPFCLVTDNRIITAPRTT